VLKSLRARNFALLVGIVLVGQLLTVLLVGLLVIRPQAQRLGLVMAHNVSAISATMAAVPEPARAALVARINAGGTIRILPTTSPPPEDRGFPSLVETIFMRAFAREMHDADVVIWQGGATGQLWARVKMGGQPYWVSYDRPKGWTPNGSLAASVLIAITLALFAGILLQRRISTPLRELADAADAVRSDMVPPPLATDGSSETAAVAKSFNMMAERLAKQERERSFMLAGISHDLRTPLAKIQLGLAMVPKVEPEMAAMFDRQLDRMEELLGQFLDYARGIDGETAQDIVLAKAVEEAAAALEIDLRIDGDTSLSADVRPHALQRALVNLMRNALVHGALPISVTLAARDGMVGVAVCDQGRGVDEAQLATLSQPFVRGDSARGHAGGSGLGLAIAHHFAVEHGGRLVLANGTPRGFVATLWLPAAKR
jgi:two-component system, OmpR family, osmolarity sensor histidine kinase EnvZ